MRLSTANQNEDQNQKEPTKIMCNHQVGSRSSAREQATDKVTIRFSSCIWLV